MTQITSHILDTGRGVPAEGVLTTLMQQRDDDWLMIGSATTNAEGRVAGLSDAADQLMAGTYKLTFYLSDYFSNCQQKHFYPYVDVVFEISDDREHYHVPLLLNPFGYTTYLGS
ncbi:MAG: hydroxyisourate hydrolase [Granulosicoccus sp.]|nr:hydroxyisourate hydrolase [Granulosicoccus sp.]